MNIAAAASGTPRVMRAGPTMTQLMMNEAVTGTARPSTVTAIAAKMHVKTRTAVGFVEIACAPLTRMSEMTWPSPVFVIVETMMPAAAHTLVTGRTERMPVDRAPKMTSQIARRIAVGCPRWVRTISMTPKPMPTSVA